jgi:BirA family biotin operon repressor/biotin-[acetyl-CoA-carboxylase] ligase
MTMRAPTLMSCTEPLRQAIAPLLPGCTVEVVPTIDSTNTELMRRARAGQEGPVLLAAETQTAGRGRLGRHWHSRPGQSLTFSLGLPLAPLDWSGLSLAVGVSLAESLHPDVRLKWPNDLWWQGRKLGGILVETASTAAAGGWPAVRYLVIGVGLNVNRPEAASLPATPPGALPATAPAGVAELLMGVTPGELLLRVAPALVRDIRHFEAAGFDAFAPRFAARDALQGREVVLTDGRTGVAEGVTAQGALRVRGTDGNVSEVSSAEVSVRPC